MTSERQMCGKAELIKRCLSLLVIPLVVAGCATVDGQQAGYTDALPLASHSPTDHPLIENQVSEDAIRVAVVDFSSASGSPFTSCAVTVTPLYDSGEKLSYEIASRLGQRPEYDIIEPDLVRQAILTSRLHRRGLDKPATLKKLATLIGADAVVLGHTEGSKWSGKGHKGASLFASIRMVSADRDETLWTIDGCVSNTKSDQNIVPDLADDMIHDLIVKTEEQRVAKLLALKEPNL